MNDNVIIKSNKRRSRYSVEVNSDNQIVVRTPQRSSKRIINDLLTRHQDWIQTQQNKQRAMNQQLSDWNDPTCLYFRGKNHQLFESSTLTPIIMSDRIHLPDTISPSQFLSTQANAYLKERCLDIAEDMGLVTHQIRIREMTSCWGTCHTNATITLNQALIQVPDWVSDYVMIHECAHLVHFNHSHAFWALVNDYTPHTKSAKKWLKDHQGVLLK